MICPFASYRPVANHGGTMISHLGLVLHVQQGNGSLAGFFNNPSSQVSAHFWCSKTGVLEQYVDTDLVAWAEANGNPYYASVESEGFDSEPLTAEQIAKIGQLLAWLAGGYKFPVVGPVAHGQPGFTPHCNPDGSPDPSWGNHPCPGSIRLNQMGAILTAASSKPPPPNKEYLDMSTAVVAPNGDIVSYHATPSNHLLEVTRRSGAQGSAATNQLSIIDITAQYPQFQVAP